MAVVTALSRDALMTSSSSSAKKSSVTAFPFPFRPLARCLLAETLLERAFFMAATMGRRARGRECGWTTAAGARAARRRR